jgi:DNA-directed RNA polymerase subunit RPC12/RpoP
MEQKQIQIQKQKQKPQEICVNCGSDEDLFKLEDDEGFVCRECIYKMGVD